MESIKKNLDIIISESKNNNIKKYYIDIIKNFNNKITDIEIIATKIIIDDIQQQYHNIKYNNLNQYICYIIKHSNTEKNTLLIALIYLNKIKKNRKLGCVKQMFVISLIMAGKYHKDNNNSLIAWLKICEISKENLVKYERIFLKILDYNLYISEDDFYYFYCRIQIYYYINIKPKYLLS